MKGRKLAFFLCTLLLVLAALFPGAWQKGTDMEFVKKWVGKKRLSYQGNLTLWHVQGDAFGMGDGSAFLSARAKTFEKRNFGVFLQVETMEMEVFHSRWQQGERPDLLSFPSGAMDDADGLQPLDPSGLSMEAWFLEAGSQKGKVYATPYCYAGHVLLRNDDRIYAAGIMPPSDGITEDWIMEAAGYALDDFALLGGSADMASSFPP